MSKPTGWVTTDAERIATLERQLAVAERLLHFTPDQLELLTDPEKLAYVTWNLSCTYTLQLMRDAYRASKMEVRDIKGELAEREQCVDCADSPEDIRLPAKFRCYFCDKNLCGLHAEPHFKRDEDMESMLTRTGVALAKAQGKLDAVQMLETEMGVSSSVAVQDFRDRLARILKGE